MMPWRDSGPRGRLSRGRSPFHHCSRRVADGSARTSSAHSPPAA